MFYKLVSAGIGLLCFSMTGAAQATLSFDDDVTGDVIFGSGNANGGFAVERANGVELGLRGKLRFDADNQPQNIFNSNGDGTYSFEAGTPPTGFGFAPGSPTTPVWNFEWSINTDYDGTTFNNLEDLVYSIEIDLDPGAGTDFFTFDPINVPYADHAIGTNATGNGDGSVAPGDDEAAYAALIADQNLAQNSWNIEFFIDELPPGAFDPNVPGVYTIALSASTNDGDLARVSIDIIVAAVPEPASIALMGLGLLGLGGVSWRRRAAA